MTILVSAEIGRSMKNIRGAEKAVLNFIFIYFKWCSEFKKKTIELIRIMFFYSYIKYRKFKEEL